VCAVIEIRNQTVKDRLLLHRYTAKPALINQLFNHQPIERLSPEPRRTPEKTPGRMTADQQNRRVPSPRKWKILRFPQEGNPGLTPANPRQIQNKIFHKLRASLESSIFDLHLHQLRRFILNNCLLEGGRYDHRLYPYSHRGPNVKCHSLRFASLDG
jgi:hypothetical protein